MIAALKYQTNHDKDLLSKTPLWKEWLAFLTVFFLGFIGGDPFGGTKYDFLGFLYAPFFRAVYGGCLSYLILLMISPDPNSTIPYSRPTKFIRGFLSLPFWIPIATLSYSIYLWHIS